MSVRASGKIGVSVHLDSPSNLYDVALLSNAGTLPWLPQLMWKLVPSLAAQDVVVADSLCLLCAVFASAH